MLSGSSLPPLYCVAVRYGADTLEHVGDTESHDYEATMFLARRVRRWLSDGWAEYLPDGALDIRHELEDAGHDPLAVRVVVLRMPARGEGLWDARGDKEWPIPDEPRAGCDDLDECEDTVLVVEGR